MKLINTPLTRLEEYAALRRQMTEGRLCPVATGLSLTHKAHLVSALCDDLQKKAILIAGDENEGKRLCEDLKGLGNDPLFYTARDYIFRNVDGYSREYEHERLRVLSRMLSGKYTQVVCTADAAMQLILPPEELKKKSFRLKPGDTAAPEEIIRRLVMCGYARAEQVEGPGQFALRGGILDIFPPNLAAPVRMEFWGDEIDSMAEFDPLTQRRTDAVKSLSVTPAAEVLFESLDSLAEKLEGLASSLRGKREEAVKKHIESEADRLRAGEHLSGMDQYFTLCIPEPASLFDYAPGALVFLSESAKVKERMRTFTWQLSEDMKGLMEEGILSRRQTGFFLDETGLLSRLQERRAALLESFLYSSYRLKVWEPVNFNARHLPQWNGSMEQLLEDAAPALEKGYSVVLLVGSKKAGELLAEDLRKKNVKAEYFTNPEGFAPNRVTITRGLLTSSVEYPAARFLMISHGQPVEEAGQKRRPRPKNARRIGGLEELGRGDYVVHASHGIGVFEGIHKLEVKGVTKDYIKIRYAKGDILYVPVTQLDLVSKYIGPREEGNVHLHKLGGTEWQKTRSRVKKAVRDMAKELIALYAKRASEEGHAFLPDTELQKDFEQRFEYEETDDQNRCIDEIKQDMERKIPMDRLLCGDVGFGKTEVALRAAFKCVAEGRQCAFLVPTTILAFQHYQTIVRRFEGFPVLVEHLSRFKTPKQQQEVIKQLKRGQVDIIVGTHRLISKDVQFRDLGLVVIDEEQRFGVAQKERLKEMFPHVDVLTLSATPIPRTLNMAMSGIRDMSVIEEAPHNRHPVQTYVLEYDFGILCDAVRKELRRGGQVYYVYNNIESIERVASNLRAALPDARIGVAHGRMSEEELSRIWKSLLQGELDVLVCTTIIETGVDVPNVNTLIIENADHMGLSQLHQLRGRVGRSARRAYAYLTFRRGKALSEIASRRLQAIREFTEFGSGFKIAMRDLEIRGAGNVLGAEQHGNMELVGYDMYLRLLNDAVRMEKGEAPQTAEQECVIDMQVEAHIPEDYIESLPQRLGIYRRIADIRSEEDASDVLDELIDRFGEPPAAVNGLIDIALLRNTAASLGFVEIAERGDTLLMYPQALDRKQAEDFVRCMGGRVMVSAGTRPYYAVKQKKGQKAVDTLREAVERLQKPAAEV